MTNKKLAYNNGEKLRSARLKMGLTLRAMGAMLGVTATCLCCYESGKRCPDLHMVRRIISLAKAHNIILDINSLRYKADIKAMQ